MYIYLYVHIAVLACYDSSAFSVVHFIELNQDVLLFALCGSLHVCVSGAPSTSILSKSFTSWKTDISALGAANATSVDETV